MNFFCYITYLEEAKGRWRQRVRRTWDGKGGKKKKAESKTNSQMSTCSSSGRDEAKRIRWKDSPDECLKLVWADETEREVEGPSWKDNQTSACSSSGWWHGKEWKDSPNERLSLIWAIWDGKWAKKEGFRAQTSICHLSGLIEIIRKVDVKGWLRS